MNQINLYTRSDMAIPSSTKAEVWPGQRNPQRFVLGYVCTPYRAAFPLISNHFFSFGIPCYSVCVWDERYPGLVCPPGMSLSSLSSLSNRINLFPNTRKDFPWFPIMAEISRHARSTLRGEKLLFYSPPANLSNSNKWMCHGRWDAV